MSRRIVEDNLVGGVPISVVPDCGLAGNYSTVEPGPDVSSVVPEVLLADKPSSTPLLNFPVVAPGKSDSIDGDDESRLAVDLSLPNSPVATPGRSDSLTVSSNRVLLSRTL